MRVVGTFPDGESSLVLMAAQLRYAAGTTWGLQRYMNMELPKDGVCPANCMTIAAAGSYRPAL
jgi:hypothetical protein